MVDRLPAWRRCLPVYLQLFTWSLRWDRLACLPARVTLVSATYTHRVNVWERRECVALMRAERV